jgi:hypothetical protein
MTGYLIMIENELTNSLNRKMPKNSRYDELLPR